MLREAENGTTPRWRPEGRRSEARAGLDHHERYTADHDRWSQLRRRHLMPDGVQRRTSVVSVGVPQPGGDAMNEQMIPGDARSQLARLDDIERKMTLLADHVGVDLGALVAVDDHNRRGPLVEWADHLAAGIDPRTGEPIDGSDQ